MMDGMDFSSPDEDPIFLARHPLYNSVVLASLFKKLCPEKDLPKCRLVCKQWHRQSLERWRSTRTLHLDYLETFSGTPSENEDGSIDNISDSLKLFLQFLEDPTTEFAKLPYRKLHLRAWHVQLGPNGMFHDPWIERLCWGSILGANITTLTLSYCKFSGLKEFQLIIYRFCPALQNLTLEWNKCDEERSSEQPMIYREPEYGEQVNLKSLTISNVSRGLPMSWLELFSHFPSIHSIRITNVLLTDFKVVDMLDALKVIKMQDGNKLPINNFDVTPCISISGDGDSLRTCAILREYNIPIKRVDLNMVGDLNRELVQNFIALQAKSMIEINAYKTRNVEWTIPLGVKLEKLETLEIRSPNDPFTDMEFSKLIPNLISLSLLTGSTWLDRLMGPHPMHPLTQMVSSTLETEGMANLQLVKLKEFKITFKLGEEDVPRLVKWFPNVQVLEMVLDDTQFSIVCHNWPNLESLVVHGKELTDAGVLGRLVAADNPGEDVEARPNVTCLEKLTYFSANDCENITQASVCHGFLKMMKLKRLQLHTVTEQSKIALHWKGIILEPKNFMLGRAV